MELNYLFIPLVFILFVATLTIISHTKRRLLLPLAKTTTPNRTLRPSTLYRLRRHTEVTYSFLTLRLETTSLNSAHEDLGLWLVKRQSGLRYTLNIIYNTGSMVGVLGMFIAMVFLGWTAANLVAQCYDAVYIQGQVATTAVAKRDLAPSPATETKFGLQPVIPGLTVPVSDIPFIFLALFACQIVHEAGHFVCAAIDAIHLNSAGLSITAIFPSAFVSLSTSNSLRSSRTDPLARITCQLRVATSGAWHNLLFWILISSVMWSEIFSDGAFWAGSGYGLWKNVKSYGPVVVSVMDDSPLRYHIPPGSIVTRLDDIYLSKSSIDSPSWYEYLSREVPPEEMDGWCVSRSWFKVQPSSCCSLTNGSETGLCFVPPSRGLSPSGSQDKSIEGGRCVDPLPLFSPAVGLDEEKVTTRRCQNLCLSADEDTTKNKLGKEVCVRPRKDIELLRIKVQLPNWVQGEGETGIKTVVWNGPHAEVLEQVRVSDLQPRFWWVPIRLPGWVDLLISYMQLITLSLFVFNLLPIPMLDGAEVLSAFLRLVSHQLSPKKSQYDLEMLEGGELTGASSDSRLESSGGDLRLSWMVRVERISGYVTLTLVAFCFVFSVGSELVNRKGSV